MSDDHKSCEKHVIPSLPTEGKKVRALVEKFCRKAGLLESQVDALQLAVSEAFNNAIEHGLGFKKNQNIILCFKISPGKLVVEVEDHGEGLNFQKLGCFGSFLNLSDRGRGFQIINALIDGVEVERLRPVGTRLALLKWL